MCVVWEKYFNYAPPEQGDMQTICLMAWIYKKRQQKRKQKIKNKIQKTTDGKNCLEITLTFVQCACCCCLLFYFVVAAVIVVKVLPALKRQWAQRQQRVFYFIFSSFSYSFLGLYLNIEHSFWCGLVLVMFLCFCVCFCFALPANFVTRERLVNLIHTFLLVEKKIIIQ